MPKIVDAEARRREIIDATARLIARAGLDAVTMRDVAAEAGWTTGVVTHYFTDKRELLLETYTASLAGRVARRLADDEPPLARLRGSLEGALPLDDDRRLHWLVTLACVTQASGDPALADTQQRSYGEFRAFVAELIDAADLAVTQTSATLAESLISLSNGIAIQALLAPDLWPPTRQVDTLDRLLAEVCPALARPAADTAQR